MTDQPEVLIFVNGEQLQYDGFLSDGIGVEHDMIDVTKGGVLFVWWGEPDVVQTFVPGPARWKLAVYRDTERGRKEIREVFPHGKWSGGDNGELIYHVWDGEEPEVVWKQA